MPVLHKAVTVSGNRMKTTLHILAFGLFTTLFSCRQPSDNNNIVVTTTDTIDTRVDKKEKEWLEKSSEIEENDNADSLRLDPILQEALKIANQNIYKEQFIKKYIVSSDSISVSVEINLDYHFTRKNPHLIIRRNEPNTIFIDIYTRSDNQFRKVLSHAQWKMEYLNDTIRDINGDGLNDFVVNWYASTGCCLKAFSNIYLLRQDKKEFSKNFKFINPTFSPKEKIIRGVCYGHPGDTELYKYKWNGEKLDTIEYVSYQKNGNGIKTKKIIISTGKPYSVKSNILRVLNTVPAEYKKIEGYDWFTGEGYE
jgi:hypothetical protein